MIDNIKIKEVVLNQEKANKLALKWMTNATVDCCTRENFRFDNYIKHKIYEYEYEKGLCKKETYRKVVFSVDTREIVYLEEEEVKSDFYRKFTRYLIVEEQQ